MGYIQLNEHYVGVPTGGQVIDPGVYSEDDARLHGTAQHLVSLGIAIWVQPPAVPAEPPAADAQTAGEPPEGLPEVDPQIEGKAAEEGTKKRR